MFLRYFLLLALASTILPHVHAQETATKVSDFNYGVAGENIITSVHSVDGQLFANLYQFYGDEAAGLLSTINESTGATTPLLDPNQTQWFAGDLFLNQPAVFEAGGMIFGLQRDQASGQNLYRLDLPEPELLISAVDMNYTKPVVLGDSLYFLTGTLPLRQSPGEPGRILAELWRTDGTAAGTQLAAPLLSFVDSDFVRVVAGNNKLLIGIAEEGSQIFYVYEPGGSGLSLVGEGLGQFIIDAPSFSTVFNPIAYHDGGFYVYEASDFDSNVALFRIDEETIAIEEVTVPEIDGPFGIQTYNRFEFQTLNNELYLFASLESSPNGNDLYRIGGTEGLSLTPIRVGPFTGAGFFDNFSNSTVLADTVYFVSSQPGDSLYLFAYEAAADTVKQLTATPSGASNIFTAADERFVYVTIPRTDRLYRYDKRDGTLTEITTEFYFRAYGSRPNVNPIAVTPQGAYWVGNETEDGLYLLAAESDSLSTFGDFITLNRRTTSVRYGADSARNEIFLFSGTPQVYRGDSDDFIPVTFPSNINSFSVSLFGVLDGETYYYLRTTLGNGRVLRLIDGVFTELPVAGTAGYDPEQYSLSLGNSLSNTVRQSIFDPGNGNERRRLLASIEEDSLRLSPFMPTGFEDVLFPAFSTTTLFALSQANGDNQDVAVYNYFGEEQYRFVSPLNSVIRDISPAGAFVETVDENTFTFDPIMLFYPADNGAVQTLNFDDAANAYNNRNFFPLNGRLLFVGDTPSRGREWLVADPANNDVRVLKDINPGRGFGTISTSASLVTDTRVYFTANDGVNGNELWYTDGTAEGTVMLPEINPGPNSANPEGLVRIDSTVFFSANGPSGYELYRFHLRDNVPELVIDLFDGEGDSHPYHFTRAGEDFYFLGREANGATNELYRIAYELVPTEAEPTRQAARIYPNPVRDLPVIVEAPEGEDLQRLQVFNQQGQLLLEASANGSKTDFNLRSIPAGTYWLRTWYTSGRFSINAVQRVK